MSPSPVSIGIKALPPECPREMPRAPLNAPAAPRRTRPGLLVTLRIWLARLYIAGATGALVYYGVTEMYGVLATAKVTTLQWLFLIVFAVNFTWISYALAQASLGFVRHLRLAWMRRTRVPAAPTIRTAILLPVYNEDPGPVAATIRAMAGPLAEAAPGRFAFFILSDTNRAGAWIDEEESFHDLCLTAPQGCPVYYRHRAKNTERKAGNVADWVQRWGGAFEAMLILDADSVLAPDAVLSLATRLEAESALGLIQTLPMIVGATSLYARLQQFANRCFGPVFANGLAAWNGVEGNYWGHNAIIRTRAFAECCGLPVLSGAPPLGGHILSHDFVEAGLLRRAGWGVRFDTDIEGSYEHAPPSLIDAMVRDRRWCQGNLQHARVMFARGLNWATRLHMLSGVMSYVSALLWLGLILLGLALAAQAELIRPEYFTEPSLFPNWPVFDAERAASLFAVSLAVVLAPKLLGYIAALLDLRRFLAFGGPIALTWSVAMEILLSALYAPVLMIAQARDVIAILSGRDSGWSPQRRGGGGIRFGEHLRRNRAATLNGLAMAAIAWLLNPDLFLWLLPVTAGMVLSVPLSWASERTGLARFLGRLHILGTPEERRPPPILQQIRSQPAPEPEEPKSSLRRLFEAPELSRWHAAQLAEPDPMNRDRFDAALVTAMSKAGIVTDLDELAAWLTAAETMALLGHRPFIQKREGKIRAAEAIA